MATIGLIDVDHHSGFPNLALMKISAWHKGLGDTVEWYTPFGSYDKVYMAKVFTYTPDYGYVISNAGEVVRGGTGYDYRITLPDEMDRQYPDYDLYRIDKNLAYGFLTRGCINRCGWCIVPKKEGRIRPYMDIEEVCRGRKMAILMDNNILACDYGLEQMEKIARLGIRVDFNQAMDARLVTEEVADLICRVKWIQYIRFGCDTTAQIEPCRRAVDMILKRKPHQDMFMYTMLHGDIRECYNRITFWRENYHRNVACQSQPMLDFTPNCLDKVPQWQKDMASWSNKKQIYKTCDFKEFSPRKGFKCKEYFY